MVTCASLPKAQQMREHYSSSGSSLQISHSSPNKCEPPFPLTCGKLSARMAGRGCCRLPSTQPLSGSRGPLRQHSLSSPSQGNHRASRPDPAREAEIPTSRGDGAWRDFPVCFWNAGAGCPGVWVCVPWEAWTSAGALPLGLVFVSLVCQRQAILVGFPSKHQTDPYPFELSQSAKKTVWTLKFLLLFSAFLTLPLPPTAGPSCQGNVLQAQHREMEEGKFHLQKSCLARQGCLGLREGRSRRLGAAGAHRWASPRARTSRSPRGAGAGPPPGPASSGSGDGRQLVRPSRRHGNSARGIRVSGKHTAFDRVCSDYTSRVQLSRGSSGAGDFAAWRISPVSASAGTLLSGFVLPCPVPIQG